jgi:hypothetical protein
LAQSCFECRRQIGQVKGQGPRGKQWQSGSPNVRARDLPALDSISQIARNFDIRSGVNDRGESGTREHVLELALQRLRCDVCRVKPLWANEVDVGVAEASKDDAALAGQYRRARRQRDAL